MVDGTRNKAAIAAWAAALESGAYREVLFGPMRGPDGFNKVGVFVDCWRKACSGPEWEDEGASWSIMGHAFMPPQEAIKWLNLRCHSTDYRIIPENNPTPGKSRDVRGRVVECIRYAKTEWEMKNDPHIEHCPACEGNNFFEEAIESNDSFLEAARKLRLWA